MSNNVDECNPGIECNKVKDVNCCKSNVTCKNPKCLDDITTECIFVEKVFDARISKKEFDFAFTSAFPLDISIVPTDLVSIETINVECNVITIGTTIDNIRINDEFFDASTTIPGPGGDQVVLNREQLIKALNPKCVKEDKGTKAQLAITLGLLVNLEIIVTGTGIDSNGALVPFTGSDQFNNVILNITLSFEDFCIPPMSFFPISLLTSCLINCAFVLTGLEFSPDTDVVGLIGSLFLCINCETLLKVPSQICTLTTGSCKIKKSKSFCDDDDFPTDVTNYKSQQIGSAASSINSSKTCNKENMIIKNNKHLFSTFLRTNQSDQ